MTLPNVPLPTDTVDVAGTPVEVRGMSRSEVAKLASFGGDPDGAENFVLACGAGLSVEDAQAWRDSVPADVAGVVLDRIAELSGLVEGAQKSD